ncbi:CHAP domain-containing protein [Bifidobacterium sp. UBA4282]|uniref:aggregation-promoting factor C-terminal-like domain-containing protein n=1 Tax=Bifidobacterium sp. UBA4282 TaxID=1946096 RepID=UPI0025B8C0C2|nr:CHAP domain-containing protein [Bifidobacterium sp. UBA4282]
MVRRVAAVVCMACVTLASGCTPLGVLAVLSGCRPTDTSQSGSGTVVDASTASGEWTGLVGMTMGQIKNKWPEHVSYCSSYDYGFQCTWWACMRQRSLGHEVGRYWGNGNQWDSSAGAAGWVQGAQAGGIASFEGGAVYGGGITASPMYGHVAVIEQVDGDTVHITEGGTGFGKVHTTTMSASHPPAGVTYWHPADGTSTVTVSHEQSSDSTEPSDGNAVSALWTCESDTGDVMVDYEGDGVHATPAEAQTIARKMIAGAYKAWDNDTEWQALVWIWEHESGWRWDAENPSSGAYGIPQALPASKLASAGDDWKDNAATQIKWGLDYIADRYGSPSKAKKFWLSHNWY